MFSRAKEMLIDRKIRSKIRSQETPLKRFRVMVARTTEQYEDAFRLLHVAYAYQGIEYVSAPKMRITRQHILPEATVLVAYEAGRCVGTMTLTGDSPAGLPLDRDYPEDLEALRESGAKLVEYGSLAIVERCEGSGLSYLLAMAGNNWSINKLGATDLVIGVNPKAKGYYRAFYNLCPFSAAKTHAELTAPVVGLHVSFRALLEHGRRYLRDPWSSGRTFVEHCTGALPACIEIPPSIPPNQLTRWKLPRVVFQDLFIKKSNQLANLDQETRKYLEVFRSEQTLNNHDHCTIGVQACVFS